MKKLLSVLITLTVLIGICGLSAFAAEPIELVVSSGYSMGGFEETGEFKINAETGRPDKNGVPSISLVYYPLNADDNTAAAYAGLEDKSLSAKITVTGGTQGTQTCTIVKNYNWDDASIPDGTKVNTFHSNYGTVYAFRFNVEANGIKLSAGYTYTFKTEIVNADGDVLYVIPEISHTSSFTTAGESPRQPEAVTGDALTAMMEKTNLNDKIDQSTITLDEVSQSNIFNASTEDVTKLFDGKYTAADGTKFGTHNATDVTVTWSYTEAVTVTDYVLVTGNDTSGSPARNPITIKLYGSNDGTDWTLVDTVEYSGMTAADHTPFGFEVDTPAAYTSYQIVMTSGNQMQLDEILTYGDSGTQGGTNPGPVDPPATEDPVNPPATEDPVDPPATEDPATTTKAPVTTKAPDVSDGASDDGAADEEGGSVLPIVIAVVVAVAVVAVVVVVVIKKKK